MPHTISAHPTYEYSGDDDVGDKDVKVSTSSKLTICIYRITDIRVSLLLVCYIRCKMC